MNAYDSNFCCLIFWFVLEINVHIRQCLTVILAGFFKAFEIETTSRFRVYFFSTTSRYLPIQIDHFKAFFLNDCLCSFVESTPFPFILAMSFRKEIRLFYADGFLDLFEVLGLTLSFLHQCPFSSQLQTLL